MTYPLLYTFRRCPYAIRARMALAYSKIKVHQYEVDLKNKPQEMLHVSPKGTVPVLILGDGHVLDESVDIMMWALAQRDPDGWLRPGLQEKANDLIRFNDYEFKPILDKYKYSQHSEENEPGYYRDKAQAYLERLNLLLMNHSYLLADEITLADAAIVPFIRQFYMVDTAWFAQSEYKYLQSWLDSFLNSELFLQVMKKI